MAADATNGSRSKRRRSRKSGGDHSSSSTTTTTNIRSNSKKQEKPSSANPHPATSLLIKLSEDAPRWYEVGALTPGRNATIFSDPPRNNARNTKALIEKYRSQADDLYRQEVQLFGKKGGGAGDGMVNTKDMSWIQSTISKGTLKDRIAAMSVLVSTHPVHKFHALDGLMQMTGCLSQGKGQPNSRVAQLAAEALEDLFVNTFLPDNRKLYTLAQRPLYLYEQQQQQGEEEQGDDGDQKKANMTKRTLSPRVLLLWRFEEMVKEKYQLFLSQYIGYTLREGTEQQKIPTLRMAATLLKAVPEGEVTVLPLICNKLGDPAKKVAAAAGHELRNIIMIHHPAMKTIVAREVQQLVHRPHLSSRALYNCVTFLNQLQFSKREVEYEEQQQQQLSKEKGGTKGASINDKPQSLPASLISTYFRLFEVAVNKAATNTDDDASALKGRLLSALLAGVNRAHPYLPAKDKELEEHVDALYRVVHKATPGACTQALLLLFHLAVGSKLDGDDKDETQGEGESQNPKHVSSEERARQQRFYETLYSRLSKAELLRSGKHLTMLFNLIYKAMKYDTNTSRVIAFAKQVLSTTMHCAPPVAAATLFLLNEVAKFHPLLAQCFSETLKGTDAYRVTDIRSHDPLEGLTVVDNADEADRRKGDDNEPKLAPLWEFSMLLKHHHPSVAHFARSAGSIDYPGDPLKDFALAPFLDKFAYRNPKSMQRIETNVENARKSVAARHSGTESMVDRKTALPVNNPSFLEKDNVPVQDRFFHLFFSERAKRDEMRGFRRHTKTNRDDDEAENDIMDQIEGEKDFDACEQEWETDDEEEAFVDQLAQKIIEDTIDPNELGPDDLDDEDPYTEGWDDMFDEGNDEDDDSDDNVEEPLHIRDVIGETGDDSDSDVDHGLEDERNVVDDDDDDAFMEDDNDDDSDDSDDEAPELVRVGDDADSEDSEVEHEDQLGEPGEDSNEEKMDLALVEDSWNDCVDKEEEEDQPTKKKRKKAKDGALYASAKDYEGKIDEAWEKMKNAAEPRSESKAERPRPDSFKNKKRNRRKTS